MTVLTVLSLAMRMDPGVSLKGVKLIVAIFVTSLIDKKEIKCWKDLWELSEKLPDFTLTGLVLLDVDSVSRITQS